MTKPQKPAEQVTQQEPTPQAQTPPSTSSAPKAGSSRVSTISDLSQMMASGQIDATQYRAAKSEIKNKGYANTTCYKMRYGSQFDVFSTVSIQTEEIYNWIKSDYGASN